MKDCVIVLIGVRILNFDCVFVCVAVNLCFEIKRGLYDMVVLVKCWTMENVIVIEFNCFGSMFEILMIVINIW